MFHIFVARLGGSFLANVIGIGYERPSTVCMKDGRVTCHTTKEPEEGWVCVWGGGALPL